MADFTTAKKWLKNANTVIVTAGNGMAQSEGLDILSEERFDDQFGKIAAKYDVHTIGDALDKKFATWSEQWAFWSELVNEYSLQYEPSEVMLALKNLIRDKKYFIATSTFAHFLKMLVLMKTGFLMLLVIGRRCSVLAGLTMVKKMIVR